MKRQGVLFCVVGPAASGKTTIVDRVLSAVGPGLKRSISTTSRQPRAGEVDGKDYYFVSRSDFEKRSKQGDFFEFEEIHGNWYGTLKSTVQDAINSGDDLVLTIDIGGALNVKKVYPKDVVIVFIVPPSWEVLQKRLQARGAVAPDEVAKRLATACSEYRKMISCHQNQDGIDYILMNDLLDDACAGLRAIVEAERRRFLRIEANSLFLLGPANEGSLKKEL